MMQRHSVAGLICFVLVLSVCGAVAAEQQKLFNGKDLKGWEGDPNLWSVEDGAITGRTKADAPIKHNTFLIWRDGKVGDFKLTFKYKIEGGNSGVQYRSHVTDPKEWVVGGYQADIDSTPVYTGILYEERGRGILAKRGQSATIGADGKIDAKDVADPEKLQASLHDKDWNEYVVEARGNHLKHIINGKVMSETVDNQKEKRADSGILALQVHAGPPMKVQFKDIVLEPLKAEATK